MRSPPLLLAWRHHACAWQGRCARRQGYRPPQRRPQRYGWPPQPQPRRAWRAGLRSPPPPRCPRPWSRLRRPLLRRSPVCASMRSRAEPGSRRLRTWRRLQALLSSRRTSARRAQTQRGPTVPPRSLRYRRRRSHSLSRALRAPPTRRLQRSPPHGCLPKPQLPGATRSMAMSRVPRSMLTGRATSRGDEQGERCDEEQGASKTAETWAGGGMYILTGIQAGV
ncbi:hypothetical protein T492DRAFT_176537 [Pavlovales sp. CCMP2436]|nr:hypothetical protein T492DRAFT_176537 [Pavlovales sp. CCMP2436]